jgi:hypothetical protein
VGTHDAKHRVHRLSRTRPGTWKTGTRQAWASGPPEAHRNAVFRTAASLRT